MENRTMKKGFTILEILVVISVIAILIGIAIPRFKGMQDEANIIKAKAELRTVQAAMESYRNQNAAYATSLTDLEGATPQIINAGMTDPISQDAYVVTRDAGGLYYVIIANGLNGANNTTISSFAVTKGADDYCVTNGTGC
jgi:general secretion pathway protein G